MKIILHQFTTRFKRLLTALAPYLLGLSVHSYTISYLE